jgi:hypothetical protein
MSDMEILDEDGYPTEAFLESIVGWRHENGFDALLQHAVKGHIYPKYWEREATDRKETVWNISTGGWSGNEAIIEALQQNIIFWAMCWYQSRRGGHHIFKCRT